MKMGEWPALWSSGPDTKNISTAFYKFKRDSKYKWRWVIAYVEDGDFKFEILRRDRVFDTKAEAEQDAVMALSLIGMRLEEEEEAPKKED